MGSSTAPNPAAIAKEIVPVQGCNSSSMWLPSHTSPEKSTQQLRQDPAAKVQQSPGQSSTAKHPANKVEVLAPLPPTRPFLLPVKILRPDTTGCIPADPEYKNKRRRRKRNEGSVMLGGVQIKKSLQTLYNTVWEAELAPGQKTNHSICSRRSSGNYTDNPKNGAGPKGEETAQSLKWRQNLGSQLTARTVMSAETSARSSFKLTFKVFGYLLVLSEGAWRA